MPFIVPAGWTFVRPTAILAVVSSVGPTVGGETVTIIGSEFRYGMTVSFDGFAATSVVILDTNHATCIPAAHAAGAVDVLVTNLTGLFPTATLTHGYTYVVAAPTITGLFPAFGSDAGSERVLITGTGFVATPAVLFGGTAGTGVLFIDTNTISVLTPAHAIAVVDVTVTNPDAQVAVDFSSFTFVDPSDARVADLDGWWFSDEGMAGGTAIIAAPQVPKHPRVWAKVAPFNTLALGGSPAASVIFRNHLIYAGDDYTLGTDQPTIRLFDGLSDRLMTKIPNTAAGAVPRAILSMLLVDGLVYLSTIDSGTTSSNFAGRVFTFDPLSQTLTPIATGFSGGEIPYTLAWHMNRLWVGTNKGNGTPGTVYYFRPNIDTAWTTDYTLTTSTTGGATSMLSFNGQLYVGTDNVNAAFAKVVVRDALGAYTTADTGTGGTAKINNGFYAMAVLGTNLYVTYWNNDTTAIAKVRKFDGTTWTTAYTGSLLTLRPYILTFMAGAYLYVVGGGVGERASLIRTADGTTWKDLTPYLSGPLTETALPIVGILGV